MAITSRKMTNFASAAKYVRELQVALSSTILRAGVDSSTATLSSNIATITKWASVITTEALTTAHTASASLVITKTGVVTGDLAMISLVGGTNTGGVPQFKAVCTTNTVTITLTNNAIITNAFNGTFVFNLLIFAKAA